MKLNYKYPDVQTTVRIIITIFAFLFSICLLTMCSGCQTKSETRQEQLARRLIIYSDYQTKYGEDYRTWTTEQKQQLEKSYEK